MSFLIREGRTDEAGTIAYTTYAGCYNDVEAPIDVDNHGLMFLNSHVRFDEIYDGSSKTLLLSEKLIRPDDLGWVSGTRATLRNTSKIRRATAAIRTTGALIDGTNQPAQDVAESLFVGGFGGYHPGVVNAAFADGSTRSHLARHRPGNLAAARQSRRWRDREGVLVVRS